MVAPSPPLSFSQVAARGRGTLCSRATLKAGVRSLSSAAGNSSNNNNDNSTQIASGGLSLGSPARAVASPHLIAIVGGAVGGAVLLAVVLALVHVLRVRRKVERFRRSMNVLGPGAYTQHPHFLFLIACADVHWSQNSSCQCQCRCRCRLSGLPMK